MKTNTALNVGTDNFWQYVSRSDYKMETFDRDRAMEYIRRNCFNARVFKLVLLGANIAFNQVRKTDKEVLGFFADFHLELDHPEIDHPVNHRIMMKMEIRREVKDSKGKLPPVFYEMALLINHDGIIVDVDYQPLERQLAK